MYNYYSWNVTSTNDFESCIYWEVFFNRMIYSTQHLANQIQFAKFHYWHQKQALDSCLWNWFHTNPCLHGRIVNLLVSIEMSCTSQSMTTAGVPFVTMIKSFGKVNVVPLSISLFHGYENGPCTTILSPPSSYHRAFYKRSSSTSPTICCFHLVNTDSISFVSLYSGPCTWRPKVTNSSNSPLASM